MGSTPATNAKTEPSGSSSQGLPSLAVESTASSDLTDSSGDQLEQQTPVSSANEAGEVDLEATDEYAVGILQNADRVWSAWFVRQGYPEPYVLLNPVLPDVPFRNPGCLNGATISTDYPNAFYCDAPNGIDNGIIIIPVRTLAKMWSGDIFGRQVTDVKTVGDYAAGVILSHEFGHSVAAELAEATGRPPMSPGKNKELIADCFAGVHTYSLSLGRDGSLDPGDVDEALAALAVIGDRNAQSTDPHGTAAERQNAFEIGLSGSQADPRPGVPANCTRAFWPELGI